MTFRLVRKKWQPSKWSYFCSFRNKRFKTISCVNLSLLLDKKKLYKLSNGFKSVIRTLLHRKEPFVIGLLNLNVVVQTPMMVNVLVVQMVTPENIQKVHKLVILLWAKSKVNFVVKSKIFIYSSKSISSPSN